MSEWYENHSIMVAVAYYAHGRGDLTTANEILHYFEKPWHYPELHAHYMLSLTNQDA